MCVCKNVYTSAVGIFCCAAQLLLFQSSRNFPFLMAASTFSVPLQPVPSSVFGFHSYHLVYFSSHPGLPLHHV